METDPKWLFFICVITDWLLFSYSSFFTQTKSWFDMEGNN